MYNLGKCFNIISYKRRVKALSLIEVSISLIIMGLIAAGALQGWKWVESTKVTATTNQILQIQTALETYKAQNHKLPDESTFWSELQEYGGPKSHNNQTISAIGATFEYSGNEIRLAPVSSKQAQQISSNLSNITISDSASGKQLRIAL